MYEECKDGGKESFTFDNRYIVQRSINISGTAAATLREASTIVKYFKEFENLAVAEATRSRSR